MHAEWREAYCTVTQMEAAPKCLNSGSPYKGKLVVVDIGLFNLGAA